MSDKYPNSNEPANPCEVEFSGGIIRGRQTGNTSGVAMGLTKREWFAGMALQGLLADFHGVSPVLIKAGTCTTKLAVEYADEILAELAK